ncbi:anti-anti-sigma factor [Bacillus sp. SLBN-46]|uniref:STAS domain-containing protein n=1 Tax=Bacillus sp. SLBN-46 TaxID=3042283 RepID=UPI00286113B6|nr:STAS domain-containing protein [Bacillus sp. SLBN-46]MDR6121206.1 anti-anti-sigma factor [Bacillus sp. SLBN-46]
MFEYQIIIHEVEKATALLKGDIDIEATELMEEELLTVLKKYQEVELHFKDVLFVDSTGIGLLMNQVRELTERKVKVTITHLSEDVYQVFDLLQIPEILGHDVFSS